MPAPAGARPCAILRAMFERITGRLAAVAGRLRGEVRLTEGNIADTLREVRAALIEADVALPVVGDFVEAVRGRAVGTEVAKSLTPGQALIQLVAEELTALMGGQCATLALDAQPPAVVLLAGLQGAGKTTTAAKLAQHLQARKKSVALVGCDVRRPAAIEQLAQLAAQCGAACYPTQADEPPVVSARAALERARLEYKDVLIVDTAGRLHIDEAMMDEVRELHDAVSPVEVLFVVDSMTGQDAVNSARAFGEALPLTGVILTKADGDARGGAALSVRAVTGKPIKMIGVGEKLDQLEAFYPERIASRILGMGEVESLIEQVGRGDGERKARKLLKKVKKRKGFDLYDVRDQLRQMQDMGGIAGLLDKLPAAMAGKAAANPLAGEQQVRTMLAVIDSMTPLERRRPELMNGSRKKRVAAGSGTHIQDVNRVLKQHKTMQKAMKKFSRGGVEKMMRGMGGMGGGPFSG